MTRQENSQEIAIVDLGGQYCHMISRRLRDIGVWSTIVPPSLTPEDAKKYSGIILSGGPQSVFDEKSPKIDRELLFIDRPVLGICYGHQLLAKELGGDVRSGSQEYGPSNLELKEKDSNSIFEGTPLQQRVWMSHSDSVEAPPAGVQVLASTARCKIAAFGDKKRKLFGVQFHPEVSHSRYGRDLLSNFALTICDVEADRTPTERVERLTQRIRDEVGDKSVFFLVSGGVDSTVAFALCARALPKERVLGVYVDTGMMRAQETEELRGLLSEVGIAERLRVRDESSRFLDALKGVTDPEEKRAIIGRLFLDVQSQACREYGIDQDVWLIGQGTIYPDTIESGGNDGKADVIKTHHNRCREMKELIEAGLVIEPLKEFYKDEVRQIGADLGLPDRLTQRWPFPGPGLAIRCLCTERDVPTAAHVAELPEFPDYKAIGLPIRSVGVQGDARTYREVVAVEGKVDYPSLERLSSHLCNVGRAHNRVILRLAGGSVERPTLLAGRTIETKRLDLLRAADFIVRERMMADNLTDAVWQFPVILIPVSFGDRPGESIVLRPVDSEDGMTASFSHLPEPVLTGIATEIAKLPGVSAVFLDISDKPPATIEWE